MSRLAEVGEEATNYRQTAATAVGSPEQMLATTKVPMDFPAVGRVAIRHLVVRVACVPNGPVRLVHGTKEGTQTC